MSNYFPSITITESVQDNSPNSGGSLNFLVGCVINSPYYKENEKLIQIIQTQSRLLELYTEDGVLTKDYPDALKNAYRLVKSCKLLVVRADNNVSSAVDMLYDREYNEVNLYSDLGDPEVRNYLKNKVEVNGGWLRDGDKLLRTPRQAILSYRSSETVDSITIDGISQVVAYTPYGLDVETAPFSFELSPSVMYIESLINNYKSGHKYVGVYSYEYGRVNGVLSLNDSYRRCERELLFNKGYNCIYLNKNKNIIFISSNRTTGTQGKTTDKECTRRLANDLNYDLFNFGESCFGRSATRILLEEITGDLRIMLGDYKDNGSIYDYKVTCDMTNNTEVDLANGIIKIDVEVQISQQNDNTLIFTRYIKNK